MKKLLPILYCAAFLLILSIPLFAFDDREDVVSEIDNRKLAEAPVFGTEGFTADYEDYFADRIGFRREIIKGYSVLCDTVFDSLETPLYTYGKDHYIFFKTIDNREYTDYTQLFADTVIHLNAYCKERSTPFYFVFDPEKASVLRDYLPEGYAYEDEWVDTMIAYLEENGVVCINNTELLTEKSQTESVFNRQYDAGHWNELGCFYGTNHILERIEEDFPDVSLLSMDDFTVTENEVTALPSSDFPISESVPSFTPKFSYDIAPYALNEEIQISSAYPHFHDYTLTESGADTLPRALIFQGSYYNHMSQFFAGCFQEYIAVHNYQNVLDLDYYFNIFQPDLVILEVAEYTIADTYFSEDVMKNLDLNPGLESLNDFTPSEAADGDAVLSGNNHTYDSESPSIESRITASVSEFRTASPVSLSVVSGEMLDRVYLSRDFSSAEYAYLVNENTVIDLQRDTQGSLWADVMSGTFSKGDTLTALFVDEDGTQYACPVTVAVEQGFPLTPIFSESIAAQGDTYTFTSTASGNRFSFSEVQLLDGATGEYLESLGTADTTGKTNTVYSFSYPDGEYLIRIKINGSKKDEYVDFPLTLQEDSLYQIQYSLDKLEDSEAVISDIRIIG